MLNWMKRLFQDETPSIRLIGRTPVEPGVHIAFLAGAPRSARGVLLTSEEPELLHRMITCIDSSIKGQLPVYVHHAGNAPLSSRGLSQWLFALARDTSETLEIVIVGEASALEGQLSFLRRRGCRIVSA